MGGMANVEIRSVTLYWQTDAQTGGNAGWAYNAIDRDGEHTSGPLQVSAEDDGGESLSDVRAAFAIDWPEVATQVHRWDVCAEGGWRGTVRS